MTRRSSHAPSSSLASPATSRAFGSLTEVGRSRRLHADQRRSSKDVADDACARRFRARALCARRSADCDRSQHGRGLFARDRQARRRVSSGDSVLADAGAWSAGASSDVIGAVQRALLSRRATHAGRSACGWHLARPGEASARSCCHSPLAPSASGCSSAPLTAGIGAALLATPAAALIGSVVRFSTPIAYAVSLLCIVTACGCAALIPALRAARIDPVRALKQH